jgi:hypothetical protein
MYPEQVFFVPDSRTGEHYLSTESRHLECKFFFSRAVRRLNLYYDH